MIDGGFSSIIFFVYRSRRSGSPPPKPKIKSPSRLEPQALEPRLESLTVLRPPCRSAGFARQRFLSRDKKNESDRKKITLVCVAIMDLSAII